jgi:putative flippase GtrA
MKRTPLSRGLAGTFARFALVGLLKTGIDFAVFNAVLLLATERDTRGVLAANTAAFAVAMAASFFLNARYTFRMRVRDSSFIRYALVSLGGLAAYNLTLGLMILLTDSRSPAVINLLKVLALSTSLAWNFTGYRYLAFAGSRRAAETADLVPGSRR